MSSMIEGHFSIVLIIKTDLLLNNAKENSSLAGFELQSALLALFGQT
jgi:hypothetical protein